MVECQEEMTGSSLLPGLRHVRLSAITGEGWRAAAGSSFPGNWQDSIPKVGGWRLRFGRNLEGDCLFDRWGCTRLFRLRFDLALVDQDSLELKQRRQHGHVRIARRCWPVAVGISYSALE